MPKTGNLDENGENDEFAFNKQKARLLVLRSLKTKSKMTKMAGVTQAKPWFC